MEVERASTLQTELMVVLEGFNDFFGCMYTSATIFIMVSFILHPCIIISKTLFESHALEDVSKTFMPARNIEVDPLKLTEVVLQV